MFLQLKYIHVEGKRAANYIIIVQRLNFTSGFALNKHQSAAHNWNTSFQVFEHLTQIRII